MKPEATKLGCNTEKKCKSQSKGIDKRPRTSKQNPDNAWNQTATSNKRPTPKLGQDCQTQHSSTQHNIIRTASQQGANPENRKQPRHTDSKPKNTVDGAAMITQTKLSLNPAGSMLREDKPADAEEDWKTLQEKANQRQSVAKTVRQQPDRTENNPNSN